MTLARRGVKREAKAGHGRAPVRLDRARRGTLALLVDGTSGPALVGCSPAWLRELARTIAAAADEMELGAGHA